MTNKRKSKPKKKPTTKSSNPAAKSSSESNIDPDDETFTPSKPPKSTGGNSDDVSSFTSSINSSTEMLLESDLSKSLETFKYTDLNENKRPGIVNDKGIHDTKKIPPKLPESHFISTDNKNSASLPLSVASSGPVPPSAPATPFVSPSTPVKLSVPAKPPAPGKASASVKPSPPVKASTSVKRSDPVATAVPVASPVPASVSNEKPKSLRPYIYTVLCFVCMFLVPVFHSLTYNRDAAFPDQPNAERNHRLALYKKELITIKEEFKTQNSRLWKIIKIALEEHLLLEENTHPAVLMLVSDEKAYKTSECLAKKLSVAFSQMCYKHTQIVDGRLLESLNPEDAKYQMDMLITDGFNEGSCVAVISHLERIPAYATTAFYQFCENDNAPFKNVAIIFTVRVTPGEWGENYKDLSNLPVKLWDKTLNDYLTYSLQKRDSTRMTDDMIGGLLSRITPSVVWVKEEDMSSLSC